LVSLEHVSSQKELTLRCIDYWCASLFDIIAYFEPT
jgi:hypothetical protein